MTTRCKAFYHMSTELIEKEINEFLSTEIDAEECIRPVGGPVVFREIKRPPMISYVTQGINSVIIFYI